MHFVFDIDGTVYFNGEDKLNKKIINSISQLLNSNHTVCFATRRQFSNLEPIKYLINKYDIDIICLNGSVTYQFGKRVSFSKGIDYQVVNELATNNIDYLIFYESHFYCENDFSPRLQKFLGINNQTKNHLYENIYSIICSNITQKIKEYIIDNNLKLSYSDKYNTYTIESKENKYDALNRIHKSEYIGFGNENDDISFISHAKKGYIVDNNKIKNFNNISSKKLVKELEKNNTKF